MASSQTSFPNVGVQGMAPLNADPQSGVRVHLTRTVASWRARLAQLVAALGVRVAGKTHQHLDHGLDANALLNQNRSLRRQLETLESQLRTLDIEVLGELFVDSDIEEPRAGEDSAVALAELRAMLVRMRRRVFAAFSRLPHRRIERQG